MAKYLTLKLPCKLYIQRFSEKLYGEHVKADNSTLLGMMAKLALEKKYYEERNFGESFIYKGMEGIVPILVNEWQVENIGYDLSTENIILINRFLEESFQQALYMHCKMAVEHNTKANRKVQGYKEAIEAFARQYKIEIDFDISFDGLKKMEYRQRKKYDDKNFEEKLNKVPAMLSPILSTYSFAGETKTRPVFVR